MKLIAKKPCSFGGKKFYIGDEIPADCVLNPNEQEKMGVLVQVNVQGTPLPEDPVIPAITVSIHADEGDVPLELTSEGLQSVFDALISTVEEAEAIIEQMTDSQALLLLHVTDGRKTIKTASENRAKELSEVKQEGAESEGEQ